MKLLKPLCPVQCNSLSIYTDNKDFLYGAISCSTSLAITCSQTFNNPCKTNTHTHTCRYTVLCIINDYQTTHTLALTRAVKQYNYSIFPLFHVTPHHPTIKRVNTYQSNPVGGRPSNQVTQVEEQEANDRWKVRVWKRSARIKHLVHLTTQHTHKQQHFKQT